MVRKKAKVIKLEHKDGIVLIDGKKCHLYITTYEDIKKGDWCIKYKCNNHGIHLVDDIIMSFVDEASSKWRRKIIATTDTKLWQKAQHSEGNVRISLPQPSKEFIEEYCRGGAIDEVLVELEEYGDEIGCDPAYFGLPSHRLKVGSDNTITIHSTKDSWNREEVSNLIKLFANNYQYASNDIGYNKWIKENL